MPATPSRIGFITKEFRIATAGPLAEVASLYGNLARDTPEPLETFFDDPVDAQIMADERLALLQQQGSLVTAQVDQVDAAANLDASLNLPTIRVIDDEQDRNGLALAVSIEIDMSAGRSQIVTWG